jgi:ABC transport system ATP-binding/permease protein
MALITLRNIQLGFGGPVLLENIDLSIDSGERVCLLGRNGTGKSTLMKTIAGEVLPDDGEIVVRQGACIARLEQEVPGTFTGTVFEVVADGLGELGGLVKRYHEISAALATGGDGDLLKQLERVQHELEAVNGWQTEQRVETVISRLSLDPDLRFDQLSGGLKRRVMLARTLVQEPDLLMLDEPTNHLDIESIDWLEEFFQNYGGTLLFVTHDRVFMQKLATRIIELDRGHLTDWPGDYANFLRRKDEMLNAEEKANQRFDKKLAQEEVWIRQGIKARRTRNEGRVRVLKQMREARSRRREREGVVSMSMQGMERSGKLVVEVENLGYAWDDIPVIKGFSTSIMRGDKLGIIGPNGSGKTTLLNLLLGRLEPQEGTVNLGTKLEIAYFDQLRGELKDHLSVQDNLADGSDKVEINGVTKHVISYLQDFLFTPDRVRQPVNSLSGGERNRLMLAKLFSRPFNILVMDEPTNDLDMETLELLEELLLEYQGTLLLVSHDRAFLNNVVTSTLVFEGEGKVMEYIGGYDDWLRQRAQLASNKKAASKVIDKAEQTPKPKQKKLSYKDQRELDGLPKKIEQLDSELVELHAAMAAPGFYQQDRAIMDEVTNRLEQLEQELEHSYARWDLLESGGND